MLPHSRTHTMKITQEHRDIAATSIKGDDAKSISVRQRIIEGLADEHPAVQAAAFYGSK